MRFHGDYLKNCLLTHGFSQILYLTHVISEIKKIVTAANGLFFYKMHVNNFGIFLSRGLRLGDPDARREAIPGVNLTKPFF
jgi:hypothetical protein